MMHCLSKLTLGFSVLIGLSGAASTATAQGLPNDIQVRLAGSSSIGKRLTTDAVGVWAKKIGMTSLRMFVGENPDDYEITGTRANSQQKMRVAVSGNGSGAGIEPLLRGQADLWMASTQVKEADLEAMRRRGITGVPTLAQFRAPGVENVVGLDALAVIVHPLNPVKRLSITQIKDMFQGRITNWSQVGGPNLPVKLYAMGPSAGYSDIFCAGVIGNSDVQKCMDGLARLAAPLFTHPDDLTDRIINDSAGLSFVAFQDIHNARPIQIGTDCDTALDPDRFFVKTDEYPFTRRLYIYTNPIRPPTASVRSYLAFVLSTEGQSSITMTSFATLAPSLAPKGYGANRLGAVRDAQDGGHTVVRPAEIRAFEEAAADADRLSITFRFQLGFSDLDSRAEADLGRLAETMALPANADKQVMLIGFSRTIGDYVDIRNLSQERAATIRERLVNQYGLKDVVSAGVGAAAAVACNLDPSYAPLNQHVEVWLRDRP